MLMPDASNEVIARTAAQILGDGSFASAAKQLAVTISGYGGAAKAVAVLETLG
ncbi:hypothetical protein ACFWPK_11215 [Nocardia sp. NPDC058519]|uniref:hypothetical protein n=1 Tax=Nocardia sp. NPDC058519 TaxID=3346535 RepID=UPI003655EC9D